MNSEVLKSLSEKEADILRNVIINITSSIDDPAFPDIAIDEYIKLFSLNYCHIARLNDDLKIEILHSGGRDDRFFEIYRKNEDDCVFKKSPIKDTPVVLPFHIDSDLWKILARDNLTYQLLIDDFPELNVISAIHPEHDAIVGLRYDDAALKECEVVYQAVLSPLIINSYYQHKKMILYRDLGQYLLKLDTRNERRCFAILDEYFHFINNESELKRCLSRLSLDWGKIRSVLFENFRSSLRRIFRSGQYFELDLRCEDHVIRIEPLHINGHYYYRADLVQRNTLIQAAITDREREIYLLIRKGYANALIARELGISVETVKKHISNMFNKTGAKNRTSLARMRL